MAVGVVVVEELVIRVLWVELGWGVGSVGKGDRFLWVSFGGWGFLNYQYLRGNFQLYSQLLWLAFLTIKMQK